MSKKKDEKFKVVCLADKSEYIRHGETVYFDNGPAAADMATKLSLNWGTKWQPRRVVIDTNWQAREAKRFYDGTYHPVPWDSERWWHGSNPDLKHFAHVSIEQDAMIAFTPNAEMGTADRQKRMSPGSYLAEYCGNVLSGDDIRDWAAIFEVTYEDVKVGFAKTADEIEDVYTKGPRSCMSHPVAAFQEYTKGVHPARMYAGPDLAVAYLLNKDSNPKPKQTYFCCGTCERYGRCVDTTDGRARAMCDRAAESMKATHYTARSVVWPEKRIYTRIYGDIQRLKACLERDGFHAGNIQGARLTRVPATWHKQKGFVVPYIDSITTVRDAGDWLVADKAGHIGARNTNGLGFDNRPRCDECGEIGEIVVADLWDAEHGHVQRICRSCNNKSGGIVREWNPREGTTGYYVRRKHAICIDRPDYGIHIATFDDYMAVCSKTNTLWSRGETKLMADGSRVCLDWYRAAGKECSQCSRGFPRSGEAMHCSRPHCPGRYPDGVAPAQFGVDLGSGSFTVTSSSNTIYQTSAIGNDMLMAELQQARVHAEQAAVRAIRRVRR